MSAGEFSLLLRWEKYNKTYIVSLRPQQTMKSDAEWAQKTARTLHRENSHHWTPGLALIPKILSQAVDPAAPKAQAFIKKFNYPWTRKEIEKYRAKLPTLSDQEKKESKKELTLPESVQKTIHLCKGLFTQELLPEIIRSELLRLRARKSNWLTNKRI
jgi:hypothetical protein